MDSALALDVCSQPGLGGTRGQPADERTHQEDDQTTDERGDQQSGFDGHQYRMLLTEGLDFALVALSTRARGSGLGTLLSCSDKRQPRFRQLQLGYMQRRRCKAIARG
jgi:hypothetical protein